MLMENGASTRYWLILILLFAAAVMLVGLCWQLSDSWKKRAHGRNWPTVNAVIDVVSVAFFEDDGLIPASQPSLDNPYYKATLTYIYNYPDQQIGDYS